uniref:Uncharacterized protein n=1 Tax=Panagrolaimus superbus TaxID=310955 RepID=A0A914Y119_9BILA
MKQILIIALSVVAFAAGQCPTTIKAPCTCSTTRFEPISIHCDRADSIESVIKALANPPQFIDSLTISNTPIEQISEGIFTGLSIRRLILQNNGLQDIKKGAFSGTLLNSLRELEIRSNGFEVIPENGITELRSLEALVLSDNNIEKIDDYTFLHYQSRTHLKKLDLSANKISQLPAQSLLGLENLQTLILDKNIFSSVPTEALKNVQTLEDLSLSVNKIKVIEPNALPLPSLKSLSLEIEILRPEVFQDTPGLLYLYLSNNRFSIVDPKSFYYVKQLKVLAMSHNVALKLIPFNAFQYIPSLIRLEMTDCSIGTLEEGAFHKTPKIQVISLARNKLKRVGVSMFSTLPYVQAIDLKQNQITTIDDYSFSRLKMLQKLDLSGNKLESVYPNTFFDTFEKSMESVLKVLYLYDNPWRCDHQIVWLAKWLRQTLDLQITAPGNLPARCTQPPELSGIDLRNAEPMIHVTLTTTTKKAVKPGYPMRAINTNSIEDWSSHTTYNPYERNEQAPVATNPLSTIITIIVIILAILCIVVVIVLIVNFLIKQKIKQVNFTVIQAVNVVITVLIHQMHLV